MYESKFPDVDDVVMVQVKSIAEMGAYVSLLEYHGIEGMILLSELSRRRIRSITKLIKARTGRLHLRPSRLRGRPCAALLPASGHGWRRVWLSHAVRWPARASRGAVQGSEKCPVSA